MSSFDAVEKVRSGRRKRRIILDIRQSLVTQATRKSHRVVLPRLLDAATEGLELYEDTVEQLPENPEDFEDAMDVVEQ